MTNERNTVLYTGVTDDILRRVYEHENGQSDFSSRYKICKLVYVESCNDVNDAISREKQIKSWSRSKKFALINSINPELSDLSE